MARVLVLRPEPGASATVRKARALGLDAVAVPLFEIEPVAWQAPAPDGFDGLLLTSANAVGVAGDELGKLRGLRVYAVGEATAGAARRAGLDVASTGDAGVDRLLASIDPDLRLLHLCGEDRRRAEAPRQEIIPVIVYRSVVVERPDLSTASGSIALLHSPRAAARFAELVSDRSLIEIAAISNAAADAAGPGWRRIEVADQASDDALLVLAARLCNKPDPE